MSSDPDPEDAPATEEQAIPCRRSTTSSHRCAHSIAAVLTFSGALLLVVPVPRSRAGPGHRR
jgi:hypothetical protein